MRVFTFGNGQAEGDGSMVATLGGKGAGLAAMSAMGVPVPPGFTVPPMGPDLIPQTSSALPEALVNEIDRGLAHIESLTGLRLGDPERPLLVSVRSGASVSMPGMMDTVLNVGMTNAVATRLQEAPEQRRFAVDSHRRFLEMFSEVALGLDASHLEAVRDEVLDLSGNQDVHQLEIEWIEALVKAYHRTLDENGAAPPADARAQVNAALLGVYRSWNNPRAVRYREANGIAAEIGTAVTVQAMVFGNRGPASATGVAFTRDPNTGAPEIFGEYLPMAQGEDVVSGAYPPLPLHGTPDSLQARAPRLYDELEALGRTLESALGDVQDLEFTIDSGTLWMLQTRSAKRSARASMRTAVDMVSEGLIDQETAIRRIEAEHITRLLHPCVDVHTRRRVLARGLPASPGAVSGIAIFDPTEAVERAGNGERVILVRIETSAEDMEAIRACIGVLTSRGGMTSHAALVARGFGRCAVTGCADIVVNERRGRFRVRAGNQVIEAGTWLTLDGSTGEVILGEVATSPAAPPPAYAQLMDWVDSRRTLQVRANADNAAAVTEGLEYGADDIGLVRTEHMFLESDRLNLVRELVLAPTMRARRAALDRLLPVQRTAFRALFEACGEGLAAFRLLDLSLHNLMPAVEDDLRAVAARFEVPLEQILVRARTFRTKNPALGHRGARLGLTFPELYEVQVRALFEAALETEHRGRVEILLPLVTSPVEVKRLRRRIEQTAKRVGTERGAEVPEWQLGVMVESPRACFIAGELAAEADFFVFGTNDLTMGTFCMQRDDAARYLPFYLEHGVLDADPFAELDEGTVGELIALAVERGRAVKPDLVCGLAGAHSGHPRTVAWCHEHGIDFVAVAPHIVPIARHAAAKATLEEIPSAS